MISLKFYQFADSKKSATRITLSGPYAPLRLLMMPGKVSVGKSSFRVPCKVNGEKLMFKVDIK